MNQNTIRQTFTNGFATLEVLMALAIVMLALSATILVSFGNQSLLADSQTSRTALSKARVLLESVRIIAEDDLRSVALLATTATDSVYTKDLFCS